MKEFLKHPITGERIGAFSEEETRELVSKFLLDNPDYPIKALMGKIIELSDRNAQPQDVIKSTKTVLSLE